MMSHQRILKTILMAIAAFSFVKIANAQLKPWNATNQIMVDLSILVNSQVSSKSAWATLHSSTDGDLLPPPPQVPISRILTKIAPSRAFPILKLKRPLASLKQPRVVAKKISPPQNSTIKSRTQMPGIIKLSTPPRKKMKYAVRSKTPIKEPRKISILPKTKVKPLKSQPKLAPAPLARPKTPVNIVEVQPPPQASAITIPAEEANPAFKSGPQLKSPQIASISNSTIKQSFNGQMIFEQGGAALSNVSKRTLDIIATKLSAEPTTRMQIQAYAGEPNISKSKARRLSLSRALAVRSYLMTKGIRSTRIDVRALGNKVASGAPNRADIKIVKN